jgi:hypothetical protein
MQSFSRVVDKELQLEDLPALGQRLNLPRDGASAHAFLKKSWSCSLLMVLLR